MRNISFALTTRQFKARTKTVTRRLGWATLQAGTHLMGVEKGMGLKKGEKVVRLGEIVVWSVRLERLIAMVERDDNGECLREGFPDLSPQEFVTMFCEHNRCRPETVVTRIEFFYA